MANPSALRVYVCHCWEIGDGYCRLCDLLDSIAGFTWMNVTGVAYSAAQTDESRLKRVRDEIRTADVVFILAGTFTPRGGWMMVQVEYAKLAGIPVVGIEGDDHVRLPREVQALVREVVDWDPVRIEATIRRLARSSGGRSGADEQDPKAAGNG